MVGSGRNSSAFVDTTLGTIVPRDIASTLDNNVTVAATADQRPNSLRKKEKGGLIHATSQVMHPLRSQITLSRDELSIIDKKYLKRIEE